MPHRVVAALAALACAVAGSAAPAWNDAIASKLSAAANAEVRSGAISGVTIAVVADGKISFVGGFGFADKERREPAEAKTVYRAGSISKLFTALAAMQLAEQERLDIDQPVTNFLPEFRIVIPFADARPITLRQLMAHRSGMVRECPVGSYFDDAEPGMEKTVASLASCVLAHPPTTKTKYSNSGVTIVGRAVERVSGMQFEAYQQKFLLGPLGMTNSSFLRRDRIRRNLAVGYLNVAQGNGGFREMPAPVFELGTLAAGNLYTTAEDLARFVVWLAKSGSSGSQLVKPMTLAQMCTPQFTSETNGFGLGFSVGHYRGRKTVSHTGAVYGFTSSLTAVPSEGIGVVVLCNDDIAVGPVRKLNNLALDLLLGEPELRAEPVSSNWIHLAGDYESQSFWGRVDLIHGKLIANISGQKLVLTSAGPLRFEASGRIAHGWPVVFQEESGKITGFTLPGQKFMRVDPSGAEAPSSWKRIVGSYGPDFIPLIVSVKNGHLYAMTENEFDYRLTPVNEYVFKMPPGLYTDEQLVFLADRRGKVHTAVLANMPLRRR